MDKLEKLLLFIMVVMMVPSFIFVTWLCFFQPFLIPAPSGSSIYEFVNFIGGLLYG
jgi:hypothetical protein